MRPVQFSVALAAPAVRKHLRTVDAQAVSTVPTALLWPQRNHREPPSHHALHQTAAGAIMSGRGERWTVSRWRCSALPDGFCCGGITGIYPPRQWIYTETYDFSPLTVRVATRLDEVNGTTVFRQTLRYASKRERDEDFDGVAASAREIYHKLERYLAIQR
jgi:hypothetical protein